jgi:hypothetical protein
MSAKNTYWISDPITGAKALAEGAAERDRWTDRGWTPADEPARTDRVWLRHETTGGRQLFPASVVEQWAPLGWVPSAPAEPVDLTKDRGLVDEPATPVKSTTPSATAGGTEKENSRG